MIILDNILSLPKSGVVIVKGADSVYVGYTVNTASQLQDIYSLFRGKSGLSLEIVSCDLDIETLKLHTEYYRTLYHVDMGFGYLVPYRRKVIQYRARIVPDSGYSGARVELVNSRGETKVVGLFDSMKEAEGFISLYYNSENKSRLPVFCINKKTQDYLASQLRLFKLK